MTEVVTLSTLGGGAALELFQAELDKVLRNIADPNTEARKKRDITLKVSILPDDSRGVGGVLISCTSRVCGLKGHETVFYFGRHAGQLVAVESDPKQMGMFDERTGIQPAAIAGGKA